MREIGTRQAGVEQFSRAQWDNAAAAEGEVRLRRSDGEAGDVLYSSTRTLGGRFLGGMRDLFSSKEARAEHKAQKATDAGKVVEELRKYLGPMADRILSDAGLETNTRLTTHQLREVLRQFDALTLTSAEVRAQMGPFAERILSEAGLEANAQLTAAQARDVLKAFNDLALTKAELRGPIKPFSGMGFTERLNDASTLVFARKAHDLETQIAGKAFGDEKVQTAYDELKTLQTYTAGVHARKAVDRYESVVRSGPDDADSEALKLAIQVKTLANGIAVGDINNGRVQNAVVRQLFRAHAPELQGSYSTGQLKLAEQLAGNTVLMDVAAGRLSTPDAVLAVRTMAQKTGTTPVAMLALMMDQFDSEVGAFSRDIVRAGELRQDTVHEGNFMFDEVLLTGDLVTKLYDSIVQGGSDHSKGSITYAKPTSDRFIDLLGATAQWDEGTGLESVDAIIDDACAALAAKGQPDPEPGLLIHGPAPELPTIGRARAELLDEIRQFDRTKGLEPIRGAVPLHGEAGSRGVTERQYKFLREVRAEAAGGRAPDGSPILPLCDRPIAGKTTTPKQEVLAYMVRAYDLASTAQAETILARAEAWFKTAPLTVTVKADEMFGAGPAPRFGSTYKVAQEVSTRSISPAGMEALVGGTGAADGLTAPMGTSANSRGENYVPWRVEKDDEETRRSGLTRTEQAKFGAVNINFERTGAFEGNSSAYGYVHLVLKPEVRDRALYNFNKTREMRGDLTMMLHDALENRNGEGSKFQFVDAVVHNALGLDHMVQTDFLQFEIEIFGDLDVVEDVQAVKVPTVDSPRLGEPGKVMMTEQEAQNIRTYYGDKAIPVESYDPKAVADMRRIQPRSPELRQMVQTALGITPTAAPAPTAPSGPPMSRVVAM